MQKKKTQRNKKWFGPTVGIGAIILIIAGIVGYNYWGEEQRKEEANETAQTFVEALEKQDYQRLSEVVSPASLEEIDYTPEEVKERYETIYGGVGADALSAENVQVAEDEESGQIQLQYELKMTTSLGELAPQSYQATLQETEDGFLIDWQPHLIFPEMEPGDTVQISLSSGERGDILDRNGAVLAGEGPAFEAGLHPATLGEGQEREEALKTIAETFDTSVEQLENLLSADWVTEESFVPFSLVNQEEMTETPGVLYQETTARTYPLKEAGAHLIGYIGEVFAEDIEANPTLQPGEIIGKSGLEATFDERLRGGRGGMINIQDSEGETKSVLQEAPVEDGENVTLTIDATLQQRYFDGLDEKKGAAVVTAPSSGEILVLTSSPSYDPELMASGISQEAYQAYVEDEATPFLPRYTARYAPGSTFKAITAAIGLEAGTTTLDETHTITGLEWQKDESWGDHKVTRVSDEPTEVSLEDAFVYSDNIFFTQEALEMGAETYMNGLLKFPFGEILDVPISMQPAQITNSGSFDDEMQLADTAFGQGQLLMSPLHQAVFYSPFANGGDLVFPKLELNKEIPEPIQPVTQEAAETVKELLIQVVENPNGSAHVLNDAPLSLAAKTGTAEIQAAEAENGNNTNGFVLAFDAEEQSFLSIILVEDDAGSNVVEQFAPILEQQ